MSDETPLPAEKDNELIDYAKALQNQSSFVQAMRMASFLSKSSFIPSTFQNKPSDCLIALQMAGSLGISPFEVMKGVYVVHGRPAFTAQFAIALANRRGPFSTRIGFASEGSGESLCVTAFAKLRESGERVEASCSLASAVKAGWTQKNDNYKAIPEQMLFYKAALMLIRRYCPEITMGMVSVDEAIELKETKENVAIAKINTILQGEAHA